MAFELKKDPIRWDIFLHKVLNGNTFLTKSGEDILILKENDHLIRSLQMKDPLSYKESFRRGVLCNNLSGISQIISSPSILCKTHEFGGKSSSHSIRAQNKQILHLSEAIKKARGEADFITLILKSGKSIQVFDIVENKKANEKADAFFVDKEHNVVSRVSLKYADSPDQMQQWGGISKMLSHDEVKSFINLSKGIQSQGDFLKMSISCSELKEYSVFGGGNDNVDLVIASRSNGLTHVSDIIWTINGSVFERENPPRDGWEPALVARYGRGRGGRIGLKDARVGIFTTGYRQSLT